MYFSNEKISSQIFEAARALSMVYIVSTQNKMLLDGGRSVLERTLGIILYPYLSSEHAAFPTCRTCR